MREEDTLGWVKVLDDVVGQESLEKFLADLLVVIGDLLKCLVGGSEDGLSWFC